MPFWQFWQPTRHRNCVELELGNGDVDNEVMVGSMARHLDPLIILVGYGTATGGSFFDFTSWEQVWGASKAGTIDLFRWKTSSVGWTHEMVDSLIELPAK